MKLKHMLGALALMSFGAVIGFVVHISTPRPLETPFEPEGHEVVCDGTTLTVYTLTRGGHSAPDHDMSREIGLMGCDETPRSFNSPEEVERRFRMYSAYPGTENE